MAFLGFLGITEGLEILLIAFAVTLLALFAVRRILFFLRFRRIKKEDMELARHMKKQLKSARFRSSSDFDEEGDELFRGPPVTAKIPVIPATYEARLRKVRRRKASGRRRKTKASGKARKAKAHRRKTKTAQ